MITWLPMLGFTASARKLDDEKLKKQVDACLWFMDELDAGNPEGHEEVRMWQDYEVRFAIYAISMVQELVVNRHKEYDTTIFHDWAKDLKESGFVNAPPPWLADVDIRRSHRSRLIAMDPMYYGPLFPGTPANMPVLWPQPVPPEQEHCGYRLRMKTHDIRMLSTGERVLPENLYYNPDKNQVLRRTA